MPEIQAVYRSTAPQIVEYWAELQRRNEAFTAHVDAVLDDYPQHKAAIQRQYGGGRNLFGLFGDEDPGKPWKYSRRDGCWVPNGRSTAGKALKERLASVCFRRTAVPGMPGGYFSERAGVMYDPGQFHDGKALWVFWGVAPELVEAEKGFDPALWERGKLSEYWAAKEAVTEKAA